MKRLAPLLISFLACAGIAGAQITCNPNGNIVLFTNYDGGHLTINVDVNIPNIKIGVVSYEATSVTLTGAFVSNVTEVRYAGYNSSNNAGCGAPTISTTAITGAPVGAQTSITYAPASPLANSFGYPSIICAYSCNTTTNQGGCNTIDQIHAYWLNVFSGSAIRMNKTQYGCWTGTQAVSGGGNCCPTGPIPLSVGGTFTSPSCFGGCTGSVTATAAGGTTPYSYQWTGGPNAATWINRCAGTYTVTVTDANSVTATGTVTVTQPAIKQSSFSQTACTEYFFNGAMRTASGPYYDTLQSQGCDSFITLNLTITPVNVNVIQAGKVLTAAATGATYKWVKCPAYTTVAGATAQTYTATANGQYAVIVTQNGCSDTSACKTVTGVGIDNAPSAIGLLIYPNPAEGGQLTIDAPAALSGKAYRLLDVAGRTVLEGHLAKSGKTVLNISTLAAGAYTLRVSGAEEAVRIVR